MHVVKEQGGCGAHDGRPVGRLMCPGVMSGVPVNGGGRCNKGPAGMGPYRTRGQRPARRGESERATLSNSSTCGHARGARPCTRPAQPLSMSMLLTMHNDEEVRRTRSQSAIPAHHYRVPSNARHRPAPISFQSTCAYCRESHFPFTACHIY